MKLDLLRMFHHHIQRDLSREFVAARVYHFSDGKWFDLEREVVAEEHLFIDLEKSKSEPVAYHATNSADAWFYLHEWESTVRLTFRKSPQAPTRRRLREKLFKIKKDASNAYSVSHNQLTQLLARDEFRARLSAAIADLSNQRAAGTETQEGGSPRILVALAMDIDHFKQVNDTWGHLYGDQVLKAFAKRLERRAKAIERTAHGRPVVHLGHPSGEEFLVFIQANAGRDQFLEWANEFRKEIAEEVLPTDDEWEWLVGAGKMSVLVPPPLQDRGTTASIGLAIYNTAAGIDASGDPVSDLLEKADTALYRAKAAGRNQVIAYDEILSSCGRVIELDGRTGVVAIDIGSNVGVAAGQEFRVFLPTFSGKTKFVVNDGRTKRTLGTYPRVESGRIVVFDVQPEISFAFVDSPKEGTPAIEQGSHLEAIPTGSIRHLLASSSKYFPSARGARERDTLGELQAFVKSAASKNQHPFALLVRFSREAEYLRNYGSAALNGALATLYREAQKTFRSAKAIEVIDRGSICIVGTNATYKETTVKEFVDALMSELPELGVVAGVFSKLDHEKSAAKGQAQLDFSNAVEFARFAAADAGRSPEAPIRHFNYSVARAVLLSLREGRSLEVAYADFERLLSLGVDAATIHNQGGLIASAQGRPKEAMKHFSSAMERDPATLVYKSNYGTAAYKVGEVDGALRVLNALPMEDVSRLRETHAYGYLGYARLLARARLAGSDLYDAKRFLEIAPIALNMPEFATSQEVGVIREALAAAGKELHGHPPLVAPPYNCASSG